MNKILPIFLAVTIVAFAVLSFVLPSISQATLRKKRELVQLRNEEKLIPIQSLLLETKKAEITLIKEAFPAKKDFAQVVQTIDTMAAQSQVLADVHFESEDIVKDANGDSIVPVQFTVEGEFANVKSFLESIAKGRYFYVFEKIEGNATDGIRGENKVVVKAKLYAATQ